MRHIIRRSLRPRSLAASPHRRARGAAGRAARHGRPDGQALGQADTAPERQAGLQRHLGSPRRHRVRAAGKAARRLDLPARLRTGHPAPRPAPAAAAPRPAQANPPQALFPKYKPEFLAKVKDLSARQVETDNVLKCLAPGLPRLGPPGKIVQNSKEVVFLYDDVNGAFFRIIPVDGRTTYRKDMPASFLGDSIGHFEGDTLWWRPPTSTRTPGSPTTARSTPPA